MEQMLQIIQIVSQLTCKRAVPKQLGDG